MKQKHIFTLLFSTFIVTSLLPQQHRIQSHLNFEHQTHNKGFAQHQSHNNFYRHNISDFSYNSHLAAKCIHAIYNQLNTLKNETPIPIGPTIKEHSLATFPQHHTEYKTLTDIYRTYTPSLSNAINKRINAFHDMTKGDFTLQCTHQSYNLNNNIKQLLQKHGFDTAPFTQCHGNQLHHALHQESLNLLDRIDHLPCNSILYDHQETLIDFTIAITDYNRENLTDKSNDGC